MVAPKDFFKMPPNPNVALFMSGGGTNAEKLLESIKGDDERPWNPAVMVTDRPETSRARQIAQRHGLPLVELDILKFYLERGQPRVSLMTPEGRRVREEWTDALRELLRPHAIDFAVLAGFVPLCNITADFPCLNVHPGDLTVERQGRRLLVGLHSLPVETAILAGFDHLRSSVILAQPYTGEGGEMDSGPVLGVSTPVLVDMMDHSIDELGDDLGARPPAKPKGGYNDALEEVAAHNLGRLKEGGDWLVFPGVVRDFALGRFDLAPQGRLLYDGRPVKTVVYGRKGSEPLPL